jgi:hypothetical protein
MEDNQSGEKFRLERNTHKSCFQRQKAKARKWVGYNKWTL